jgi:hypothetical protein
MYTGFLTFSVRQLLREFCAKCGNTMLVAIVLAAGGLAAPSHAAPAGALHYPDLRNIIPTASMSIVQTATGASSAIPMTSSTLDPGR